MKKYSTTYIWHTQWIVPWDKICRVPGEKQWKFYEKFATVLFGFINLFTHCKWHYTLIFNDIIYIFVEYDSYLYNG